MGKDIDSQEIARQLLTVISNDTMLCTPVYLEEIESEHEVETWEDAPLVYLWNEDRQTGSFSLSVNGKLVEERLETLVPREHEQFELIRDGVINAIAQTAQNSVVETCEQLGAYPSKIFGKNKDA
jgi:hypothetical protein